MKIDINHIKDYLTKETLKFEYHGDASLEIEGFCPLSEFAPKCITWIKKIDNYRLTDIDSSFRLLIVADKKPDYKHEGYNLLIANNPKAVYFDILNKFFLPARKVGIAETALIETKTIGENVSIGHHCYISPDVVIGNNVTIKHNVTIECPTIIGDDCIIESGVVIGTFGYGYYEKGGRPQKVPDFGGVTIGNRVEIGANTCIVRGTLADTIIEDDVKIDNLCHIAHNAIIGARSYVIALSMIAGSSKIEHDAYIAPGAMIMNQLTIGNNSIIGMGAVVTKDVERNKVMAGVPAKVLRENIKQSEAI